MSFYVEGYYAPENCGSCILLKRIGDIDYCPFCGEVFLLKQCDDDCPIIPFKPHGKLLKHQKARIKRRAEMIESGPVSDGAEFIDREAAKKVMSRFLGYLDADMIERLQIAIQKIPAADVARAVRCKDCTEWQRGWNPVSTQEGAHFCAITGLFTDPDWFCKDGSERADAR